MVKKRVAYLGPEGTFSCEAAQVAFHGISVEFLPCASFRDIFKATTSKEADVGIIPIENSLSGVVPGVLDELNETEIYIVGEHIHAVCLCLITRSKIQRLNRVHKVYSHSQSFGQCREWLDANLPNVPRIASASTVEAVKEVEGSMLSAAVGSEMAAELYGLHVLAKNIEDDHQNYTRFVVVSSQPVDLSESDKTSIIFVVNHEPGALLGVLECFSKQGVNLTTLQSRPVRGKPFEYMFHCDFTGHQDDPHVARALSEVQEHTTRLKVLGSYPKAEIPTAKIVQLSDSIEERLTHACAVCGERFRGSGEMCIHMRIHAHEVVYCKICGEKFRTSEQLLAHHDDEHCKEYCSVCGRKFLSYFGLKNHIKNVHDGEEHCIEPCCECMVCKKTFSLEGYLQAHLMTDHTEVKPHECEVYKKRFIWLGDLESHLSTH